MKYPWMPLFWGDFLANTMHLSAQEAGAYLFLIAHAWENEGKIPPEKIRLARIAHVQREHWNRVWSVLENFFEPINGNPGGALLRGYHHVRVLAELQALAKKSEKSKEVSREQHREHGKFTTVNAPLTTSRIIKESTSLSETRSAPSEPSSKRGPATALPTGAPARSEGTQPRSGSNYAVNAPATMAQLERAKADRQKQRLGMSPDEGDRHYPARPRPEHAHALEPIPDRLVKRPSGEEQDFAPGTLPQCGNCNCPKSPSGEQKCWAKILANSTMGKLEHREKSHA